MYKRLGRAFRRRQMLPMGIEPFDISYLHKALSVGGLVGAWLQGEGAGLISYDSSGHGYNGAYTGVTLGQPGVPGMGYLSPFYDGANDFNNIYSVALNAGFNGAEGTLIAWARVANAGVWTDALNRRIVQFQADANNFVRIVVGVNNVTVSYRGSGTLEPVTLNTTTLDWFPVGITWDFANDTVDGYLNGLRGIQRTVLGAFVGPLSNVATVIGAANTVPVAVFLGNMGPTLLFNDAKSPAEMAYLSMP